MKIVAKPALPENLFAQKVSPALLAQAVRVYQANQHQGTQSVLTRAEVSRTRKKLYKQKGTGGARHGDRKAPIFVGGGVSFAPKPRDLSLSLPGKMKQKALVGSLSLKAQENQVVVVSGMSELSGKTKELASFLKESGLTGNILLVVAGEQKNVVRAGRNLMGVKVVSMKQLSTYDVLWAQKLVIMEEALEVEKKAEKKEKVVVEEKTVKKQVVKKAVVKKVVVKKTAKK